MLKTKAFKKNISAESLVEFALLLNQQKDFSEILRIVALRSVDYLNAQNASIQMLNPKTRETIKTVFKDGSQLENSRFRNVHDQICGWMLKNDGQFWSKDIKKDQRFKETRFEELNIQSVLAVKLLFDSLTFGFLIVFNKTGNHIFEKSDIKTLENIAIIASPYLRNAYQIQHIFDTPLPEETLLKKYENIGLYGKSKKFVEILHSIEAAAKCDVRVMLEGKSGTGKELIAKAIHKFSNRELHPFVAVDCGAIPEQLFESELFGHEKGAFTGANQKRIGLFEEADEGTLFLDEIANMPPDVQSKLMRVLQQKEIRPVGSNTIKKIDVRIISATSQSLRELVAEGKFRDDLFYRLHVYPIYVPNLSERKADIITLAYHFLEKFTREQGKRSERFHEKLLEFIKHRPWPGNIRELENFIERLVTLTKPHSKIIDIATLPQDIKDEYENFCKKNELTLITKSLKERLSECEESILLEALEATDWNQSRAARNLRMSEQNFRYRMKKLGIKKGS